MNQTKFIMNQTNDQINQTNDQIETQSPTPFTPKEFTKQAKELWKAYKKEPHKARGHMAVDNLMWDALYAAGYEERLEILDQIPLSY